MCIINVCGLAYLECNQRPPGACGDHIVELGKRYWVLCAVLCELATPLLHSYEAPSSAVAEFPATGVCEGDVDAKQIE